MQLPPDGRLPAEPASPARRGSAPWSAWDLVFVLLAGLVFSVGAVALAGLTAGAAGWRVPRTVAIAVLTTIVYACLLLAAYLLVFVRRRVPARAAGLAPVPARVVGRMVGLGLGVVVLNGLINAALTQLLGSDVSAEQRRALVADASLTGADVVALGFAVVVAAPFTEELLFRGLLYRYFRARTGAWPAAAISAAVFAFVHGIPALVPALFVLGLVLARVTERYGSIVPAITVHAVNNLVAISVLYLLLRS